MRRFLMAGLLLVLALALAACGSTSAPTKDPAADAPAGDCTSAEGKIQLAGSTTVQPLAEELGEAFMETSKIVVEVQGGGSSVGVTSAGEGMVDIGMASP